MSDDLFEQAADATPLTTEEREGLIPSYITLRGELNEAEQANILEAEEWAFARRRNVMDEQFLNRLHKRMFGNVWKWAGQFRRTGKNIGIDAYKIPTELRQLVDNTRYWTVSTTYSPDEIAARFHHQLVFIHPYANGNGRHARLATDLLLVAMEQLRFSWGSASLVNMGKTRSGYIEALRAADRHDYGPLMAFVRS